ncbi:MAG: 2-amino-4-hydroxy-6-hydroxymethyldihydropteridine diphosphokinase [Polyangiales bacterium]
MVVVIGVGANLGDKRATIAEAVRRLIALPGVTAHRVSSAWETAPVGGPPQPHFINGAVMLELDPPRSARSIVAALLAIEAELGRVRGEARNEPRAIDLDLLWTDAQASDHPDATVPHPRLHDRPFALAPLVEVCPEARDSAGIPYRDHLAGLDSSEIRRLPEKLG